MAAITSKQKRNKGFRVRGNERGAAYTLALVALLTGIIFAEVMLTTAFQSYQEQKTRLLKEKAKVMAEGGEDVAFYIMNTKPCDDDYPYPGRATLPYTYNDFPIPWDDPIGHVDIKCENVDDGTAPGGLMDVTTTTKVDAPGEKDFEFTRTRRIENWNWAPENLVRNGTLDEGKAPDSCGGNGLKTMDCANFWHICWGGFAIRTPTWSTFDADYLWDYGGARYLMRFELDHFGDEAGIVQGVWYGPGETIENGDKLRLSGYAWKTTEDIDMYIAAIPNRNNWWETPDHDDCEEFENEDGYPYGEDDHWLYAYQDIVVPATGSGWIRIYVFAETDTSHRNYAYFNNIRLEKLD